jgi:CheY-like chemotaxis protein
MGPDGHAPILVIEDDDDVRDSLSTFLQEEGYQVRTAANGRDALELLATDPVVCLILLDLTMPVMDGWEFRRRQREDPRLAHIPVVLVTGVYDRGSHTELPDAVACLLKPVDLGRLCKTLASYC